MGWLSFQWPLTLWDWIVPHSGRQNVLAKYLLLLQQWIMLTQRRLDCWQQVHRSPASESIWVISQDCCHNYPLPHDIFYSSFHKMYGQWPYEHCMLEYRAYAATCQFMVTEGAQGQLIWTTGDKQSTCIAKYLHKRKYNKGNNASDMESTSAIFMAYCALLVHPMMTRHLKVFTWLVAWLQVLFNIAAFWMIW